MSGQPAREWTDDPAADRILDVVADVAPEIRAALPDRRAALDGENPTGDRTYAADDYADELLADRLVDCDAVAAYASEERAGQLEGAGGGSGAGDGSGAGGGSGAGDADAYHVAVDPLDGSSNLRSNNPMGTIVGVYDAPLPAAGTDLVAAAVVLYGPNTTMLVADGDGVGETLLDGGDRRLLDADVSLPADPTVYGFGGRRPDWPPAVRSVVESFEADRLKLRYGGALVADVAQVLTHGGVFAYPELADRPEGKLRYYFECAPIGFLVESAGGRVSDGDGPLLDAAPESLHARTPFYVGNASLVDRIESELA